MQHHECSDILLFITNPTCFGRNFGQHQGILQQHKGRVLSFTILFRTEIIIFITKYNEIFKLRSLSIGKVTSF